MSHFIEKCRACGDVITQCRCASPNKPVRYGLCGKCKDSVVNKEGKPPDAIRAFEPGKEDGEDG